MPWSSRDVPPPSGNWLLSERWQQGRDKTSQSPLLNLVIPLSSPVEGLSEGGRHAGGGPAGSRMESLEEI
jgi:hypothetical protein